METKRRIIVVEDRPPEAPAAMQQKPADLVDLRQFANIPPGFTVRLPNGSFTKMTRSGYPAGIRLRSQIDGRLYQVESTGAIRRLTPKPLSKKARRKKNHE